MKPPTPAAETWRLLPNHVGDSERHMGLTDHLVRSAALHGPAVWWHSTHDTTVLVGPAMHRSHVLRSPLAVRVLCRHTGGGAVLAGRGVWALDLAVPAGHRILTGDILEDYRWLGLTWASALQRLGIEAICLGVGEARMNSARHAIYADAALACFALTAPYEVVCGEKKVVGLSQVRRSGGVLFSCCIHVDGQPSSLSTALPLDRVRRSRLASHLTRYAASASDLAGRPVGIDEVTAAFRASLAHLHGIRLRPGAWP